MAIIKNKIRLARLRAAGRCLHLHRRKTSRRTCVCWRGTVKRSARITTIDNMELTVPNVSRAIKDMYNKEKAENLPT